MKKTLKKNPIVICCYNRPEHLKKLIKSIKHLKRRKFYFISDGPKNSLDNVNVERVRDIIKNLKLDHKYFFFKKNIGLPNIFLKGISKVFKIENQVIILEDDTIPSKSFFKYCDVLLEKYKNYNKVSQISGCNLHERKKTKLHEEHPNLHEKTKTLIFKQNSITQKVHYVIGSRPVCRRR